MLRTKNNRGSVAIPAYVTMLIVGMLSAVIMYKVFDDSKLADGALYSANSMYAAESGVEKAMLQFKKNPRLEDFVPETDTVNTTLNGKNISYRDMNATNLERVIEEEIPAGESIQFFFKKKDLNPLVKQIHVAYLKIDQANVPTGQAFCDTRLTNASVELGIYATTDAGTGIVPSYTNMCTVGGKASQQDYTDDVSRTKLVLQGYRCVLNDKGHTPMNGVGIEFPLYRNFNNQGDADPSNDTCDFSPANNSIFTSTDKTVMQTLKPYTSWYTVIKALDKTTMVNDDDVIGLFVRAIDDDAQIAIWGTDDNGVAYDIPSNHIYFSAVGLSRGNNLQEGVLQKIRVKKRGEKDLLPIFDYSLYSEAEFVK